MFTFRQMKFNRWNGKINMKSRKERCDLYDYSLTESARQQLKKPNKFICKCIHCRGQATTEKEIQHSKDCCFSPSNA